MNGNHIVGQSRRVDLHDYPVLDIEDCTLRFYDLNYEGIESHIQSNGGKVVVGPKRSRQCRFCGKTETSGEATFKLEAHGFPASIGNRTFFTNYECDACNNMFGNGIENQLGIYMKPYRTLAAIRGHAKFPVIKSEKDGWRIWRDENGLHIYHNDRKRIAKLSDDGKTLSLSIPRDPYKLLDVYKAFVKMALSLMPEDEIDNFRDALEWIRGEGSFKFVPPTISSTFVEGVPLNVMSAILMRRRYQRRELPYMFALIIIANTQFQFMVPSHQNDKHLSDKRMNFPPYPFPVGLGGKDRRIQFDQLDLSSGQMMVGELVNYDFTFEDRLEVTPT